MTDREEQLTKLTDTVSSLLAVYRNLPDPNSPVYEAWSAKDVLGHITFWHESFARNVRDLARGARPAPLKGRLMDLNLQGVEALRDCALPDVLERLAAAQRVIQDHILNPELKLIPYRKGSRDYTPEEHLDIVNRHIQAHLKDVQAALKARCER